MSLHHPHSDASMQIELPEKLAMTLFLVILAVTTPPWVTFPTFLLLLLLRRIVPTLRPTTREADKRFTTLLRSFLLIAILMTVLNSALVKEGELIAETAGIRFFLGGLLFGIRTASRLLLLATALLVFFGSTEMARIAAFLHSVGLPSQVVMSLLLTLYFLDSLPEKIRRIFEAQHARGAPVRRNVISRTGAFFSVLAPLVLSSLVESINRGTALQMRGYHAGTRLFFEQTTELRLSPVVITFLILSLLALLLPWVLT